MDNYHVAWCSLSYCRCVQSLYWLCLNYDFTAEVVKSFGMYPQLLYFFFFSIMHYQQRTFIMKSRMACGFLMVQGFYMLLSISTWTAQHRVVQKNYVYDR